MQRVAGEVFDKESRLLIYTSVGARELCCRTVSRDPNPTIVRVEVILSRAYPFGCHHVSSWRFSCNLQIDCVLVVIRPCLAVVTCLG